MIRRAASPIHLAVVAGFAGAPLAAVVVAEQNAIFRGLGIVPFGVLLATIGAHHLWFAPIRKPLRWPYPIVSLAIVLAGAGYALWTLATQSRVTSSALPLMALGVAIFAAGLVLDRLKTWRIVAICLLALIPLQCAALSGGLFFRLSHTIGGLARRQCPRGTRGDHCPRLARTRSLRVPEPAGDNRAGRSADDVHRCVLAVLSDQRTTSGSACANESLRAGQCRCHSDRKFDPCERRRQGCRCLDRSRCSQTCEGDSRTGRFDILRRSCNARASLSSLSVRLHVSA